MNVWLALNYAPHTHNSAAVEWYEALGPSPLFVFCRHTQMGLFRLLSTESVLKQDSMSQKQCWDLYNKWVDAGRAHMVQEPLGLEPEMRLRTSTDSVSPKAWADAYLAAFAVAGELTLVTFDRALASKAEGSVLLS